jgi:hypothetical protein
VVPDIVVCTCAAVHVPIMRLVVAAFVLMARAGGMGRLRGRLRVHAAILTMRIRAHPVATSMMRHHLLRAVRGV